MAGIQISGLLSNQAFDWKSVVDQLIAADSIPVKNLQDEQATNSSQVTALGQLQTDMTDLQASLQNIRAGNLFSARIVSTDTTGSTWSSSSSDGAALGSYAFSVSQLASQAVQQGGTGVSAPLSATSDVSGLTVANLRTATAVTAGTFTVNGAQVSIATTDSLAAVFTAINTATGGDITASYDPVSDKVSLTSASSTPIVLGAANDSSNFISAMKLFNNGAATVASAATLGVVKTSATLAAAGLGAALSGQDGSGNGAFTINGVSLSYNINTDTVATILARINNSSAGVTATYDGASNRFNLTNTTTGDFGMGLADTTGNLLAAMKLTSAAGAAFTRGTNAQFTVNGGPVLTSTSNTLSSSIHGINGLSVTVNSKTTQTLTVASDTAGMQTAIQDFVAKFNQVQNDVNANTKVTITGSNVSKSVLTGNREVEGWAQQLQSLAFGSIPGVSKTVTKLDDLGIDFDGTSLNGNLVIKDSTKLANALAQNPADVQSFFLTANTGFVAKLYGFLTTSVHADITQQSNLSAANNRLAEQITTLQTRLADERTTLTNSFIAMLDAQSKAQSQNTTLTNAFFSKNSNGNN
jgi:flagellar hook-associated protein 2